MANALTHLQAARNTISRVRAAADQLHSDLQLLANDRDYTAEAKHRRMAPLLARKAELQQELVAARDRLNRAEGDAARQLCDAGAANLPQQTCTYRPASRAAADHRARHRRGQGAGPQRGCLAPGLMEALNPLEDESHSSAEEVPR